MIKNWWFTDNSTHPVPSAGRLEEGHTSASMSSHSHSYSSDSSSSHDERPLSSYHLNEIVIAPQENDLPHSDRRRQHERTKEQFQKLWKTIECRRVNQEERIYFVQHGTECYFLINHEDTIYQRLFTSCRTVWSEGHARLPFYDALVDSTRMAKDKNRTILLCRLCDAELRYAQERHCLQEQLTMIAEHVHEKQKLHFNAPQSRLEAMMPAAIMTDTLLPALARDTLTKRLVSVPVATKPASLIVDTDEDSGDGKRHKNRVRRKEQQARQQERTEALKQRMDANPRLRQFMQLPEQKRKAIVAEIQKKKYPRVKPRFQPMRSEYDIQNGGAESDDDDDDDDDDALDPTKLYEEFIQLIQGAFKDNSESNDPSASSSSMESQTRTRYIDDDDEQMVKLLAHQLADDLRCSADQILSWYKHHYSDHLRTWYIVPFYVGIALGLSIKSLATSGSTKETSINAV